VDKTISASLESIDVSGTPTIFLVDDKGRIERSWIGFLADDRAAKVLGEIESRIN
jgi:peroxiredoxin